MQLQENYMLDGRYQLRRFIGSGSFGEVWVAYDTETELEVAVKIYLSMDSAGLTDFKKEFQLSFDLNHTNLLHANYLGINPEDNRAYLVMPLCPDGSVGKCVGKISENDLWKFIKDVSSGLAYLHEQNPPVIHQDIKPDNILKSKNGDYQITDFGISKRLKSSMKKSAMSMNSAGAIAYMGPERFSNQYRAVKASDIWSFGATLYELATGDLPFCGMGGSMQKNGADMPEMPDGFSKEMGFIILACLAKETWERPTAKQIEEYAAAVIDGREPSTPWRKDINPAFAKTVPLSAGRSDNSMQQTMMMPSPAAKQNNSPEVAEQPAVSVGGKKKSSVLPWILSAVAGLALGIVLKLVIG